MQADLFAGWHLVYDGITSAAIAERLGDMGFFGSTLTDFVRVVGWETANAPIVRFVRAQTTAHIICGDGRLFVHATPEHRQLSLDVFSRRIFAEEPSQKFLRERFEIERRSSHWIPRNWP